MNNSYNANVPYLYVRKPSGLPASELPQWASGKPGAPSLTGVMPVPPDQRPTIERATPLVYQDVLTPNFRCGRDAWKPSPNTSTADVLAGDSVSFQVEPFYFVYMTINHIGPGQAYLAKKPDGVQLNQWDGDGDWFKIDYSGPLTDEKWKLLGSVRYNGTAPPRSWEPR